MQAASGNGALRDAVGNLYVALGDAIELQRPVCDRSGRCCRFEEYGHRLFVTTAEMATFFHDLKEPPIAAPGGCPFQKSGLCSVHPIRPLGCRIYFCDPSAAEWQRDQYERIHRELRRLHEQWSVPYFYVEWREALESVLPDR